MKKMLSHKIIFAAALLLTCVMISGIGITNAWFRDKESKGEVIAALATVDIELQDQSFDQATRKASFTVKNNSNINIYLRAGIIFELTAANGEPVIADTGEIAVEATGSGWVAEQRPLNDGDNTFKKWFLKYWEDADYKEVNPGTNPVAEFIVTGIPDGCVLTVNVVPEAVQDDDGDDALNDFKKPANINPSW